MGPNPHPRNRICTFTFAVAAALCGLVSASLLVSPSRAATTLIGSPITSDGYTFTNFDFSPLTGTATGSNANGISNTGQVTGTTVDVNGMSTFTNFSGNPLSLTQLNTGTGQTAFAINGAGNVVGGNGTNAFFLPNGGSLQNLTTPATAINAFGINDNGNIVGQFTSGTNTPGFILNGFNSTSFTTINQPVGVTADVINAQGINNHGLVVGFYLGNDGQVHGFTANAPTTPGTITATAVADPKIPPNPGNLAPRSCSLRSSGSTIMPSQWAISATPPPASTVSFYNTTTGTYTFLDDPAASFHNGVEITQITGINNLGDISGFYTDANGTFHSFFAAPATPLPATLPLFATGLGGLGLLGWRRKRKPQAVA